MKLSLDYNITERKKYKERGMMARKVSQHDRHMLCSNQKTTLACTCIRKKQAKRFLELEKGSVSLYCNYKNRSVLSFISFYLVI